MKIMLHHEQTSGTERQHHLPCKGQSPILSSIWQEALCAAYQMSLSMNGAVQ
jgi:hypothetical protein